LWNSSLSSFLQPPITSSVLGTNISLSTLSPFAFYVLLLGQNKKISCYRFKIRKVRGQLYKFPRHMCWGL
jgi:hypothetical protein